MAQTTFLEELFKPLHGAQRNTLTALVDAICVAGSARTIDLALALAADRQMLVESGMNRVYRCLRNPRINWDHLVTRQAELLIPRTARATIAVDWTEWHSGMRMLVGGLVTAGRAVPLLAKATTQRAVRESQNTFEHRFLRELDDALRQADRQAVLLFDRGFLRTSLISFLTNQTDCDFVIRLAQKRRVWRAKKSLRLDAAGLYPGHILDLGVVSFRGGRGGRASGRVVGVWAHGQREPWWLVTSLLDDSVESIVRLYAARMGVEELFRDQKGCRYGLAMEWTRFARPEQLERMTRIVGIALVLMSAVGQLAAHRKPKLLMPTRRGQHRLSVFTLGRGLLRNIGLRAPDLTQSYVRLAFPLFKPPNFPWMWKPLPFRPLWEVQK